MTSRDCGERSVPPSDGLAAAARSREPGDQSVGGRESRGSALAPQSPPLTIDPTDQSHPPERATRGPWVRPAGGRPSFMKPAVRSDDRERIDVARRAWRRVRAGRGGTGSEEIEAPVRASLDPPEPEGALTRAVPRFPSASIGHEPPSRSRVLGAREPTARPGILRTSAALSTDTAGRFSPHPGGGPTMRSSLARQSWRSPGRKRTSFDRVCARQWRSTRGSLRAGASFARRSRPGCPADVWTASRSDRLGERRSPRETSDVVPTASGRRGAEIERPGADQHSLTSIDV